MKRFITRSTKLQPGCISAPSTHLLPIFSSTTLIPSSPSCLFNIYHRHHQKQNNHRVIFHDSFHCTNHMSVKHYSTSTTVLSLNINHMRNTMTDIRDYITSRTIYHMRMSEREQEEEQEEDGESEQLYQEPIARFSHSTIDHYESRIIELVDQLSVLKQYSVNDLLTMLQFLQTTRELRSFELQHEEQSREIGSGDDHLIYVKCLQLSEYLLKKCLSEMKLANHSSQLIQVTFHVLTIRLQISFQLGDITIVKNCFQDALKYLKREISVYGQKKKILTEKQSQQSQQQQSMLYLHLEFEQVTSLFTVAPHLGLYQEMLFVGDVLKRCYPSERFPQLMQMFYESADSVSETNLDYSAIYQLLTMLFMEQGGQIENFEYDDSGSSSNGNGSARPSLSLDQFQVQNLMFNHLETQETGNTMAHKQFSDYTNFSEGTEWIKIDYELPALFTHGRAVLWYQMNGGIPLAGVQLKNGDIHVIGNRDLSGGKIAPADGQNEEESPAPVEGEAQASTTDPTAQQQEQDTLSYSEEEREEMIRELEKSEDTVQTAEERAHLSDMIDKLNDPNKMLEGDEQDEEDVEFQSLKVNVHFHFIPEQQQAQQGTIRSYGGKYYRKIHAIKEGSNEEAVIKFIFDMKADLVPSSD